jgi:hypothetical protein
MLGGSIEVALSREQREPENRRRVTVQRIWLVSVLVLVLAACGAAPALELKDEPFRDQANGYSIRYPVGWQHVYLERVGGLVLYQSGEPIEDIMGLRAVAQVPVVVIIAGPLEAVPYVSLDDVHNSKTMLQAFLAWLGDAKDGRIGRIRTITVAGRDGAVADIRWSQGETIMAGSAVAVYLGDRGVFIEGAGQADSWKAFEPTFEASLESVTLDH